MTPANVSGVDQMLPILSAFKSNLSVKDEKVPANPGSGTVSTRDSQQTPVDTVRISDQSRQAMSDVKKEEALIERANKEKSKNLLNSEVSDKAAAKVEFVYDLKGDLSIRYMDSSDRLVYQVPSELMLRMAEAGSKPDSSVDTKI